MFLIRLMAALERRYLHIRDVSQTIVLSSRLCKCGSGVCFRHPCDVYGAQHMEVGDNVYINRGAVIRAQGGLKIGDNVIIARNVAIYTYNHNFRGEALPFDRTSVNKPVGIGDNVWIGVNVTIVPGVKIGEGAIIGAGTVVSQDVPPLAIVGSAPQRIIGYRDEEHYRTLRDANRVWADQVPD